MNYKRRIIGGLLLLVGVGALAGGVVSLIMNGNVGLMVKSLFGAVVAWGIAARVLQGGSWWEWNKNVEQKK